MKNKVIKAVEKVKVFQGAWCTRCHKRIGKGRDAIVERTPGGSFFYYHPHCYKKGYHWWHGKYVKD